MILILSSSDDKGVVKVCKWLKYYGYDFVIATEKNIVKYHYADKGMTIDIDGKEHLDIKTGWIRNPYLSFSPPNLKNTISNLAEKYIFTDYQKNLDFMLNHLKKTKNFIGTFYVHDINKLMLLESAVNLGILVPKYIVTTSKTKLLAFIKLFTLVITKSIGWNINFTIAERKYFAYTELITPDFIKKIPNTFANSFFQEYINADLELRVVIVGHSIYAMAHQNKEKTGNIDLRKGNLDSETFPYLLPEKIGKKLIALMLMYNLDFCVFDILVRGDDFYLIDINPTGQFTNVSQRCNYNIELTIAKTLIARNNVI
jgi:hypothetical protein